MKIKPKDIFMAVPVIIAICSAAVFLGALLIIEPYAFFLAVFLFIFAFWVFKAGEHFQKRRRGRE